MKKYYLQLEIKNNTSCFTNFNDAERVKDIKSAIFAYNSRFNQERELILKDTSQTLELYLMIYVNLDVNSRHISWFSSYLYHKRNWKNFSGIDKALFSVKKFEEISPEDDCSNTISINEDDSIGDETITLKDLEIIGNDNGTIDNEKPKEIDKTDKVIIKINSSKLRTKFIQLKEEILGISDWKTPCGISITLLVTLLTADFKGIIFSSDVYKGIAIAGAIFSLYIAISNYKKMIKVNPNKIINNIMNDLECE